MAVNADSLRVRADNVILSLVAEYPDISVDEVLNFVKDVVIMVLPNVARSSTIEGAENRKHPNVKQVLEVLNTRVLNDIEEKSKTLPFFKDDFDFDQAEEINAPQ